jgi:PKD repeat protein
MMKKLLLVVGMLLVADWVMGQGCNANFTYSASCNVVTFTPAFTGPNTSYSWNFGDGNTSMVSNPMHTYLVNTTGQHTFSAILTVTSGMCIDTDTMLVSINVGSLPDD